MDFVPTVVGEILKQGFGYVLFVAASIYAYLLDKRLLAAYTAADQQADKANAEIREMYEKRINEFRELLDVMANSTNTVTAMHSSMAASTEAINQLAAGFATLLQEFHAQQARWDDRRGAMAEQLKDIQQRVEELQRRGRAA